MLGKFELGGLAIGLWLLTRPKSAKAAAAQLARGADDLLRRANQGHAHDPWFDILTHDLKPPLPADVAEAVCRWIGIESSGDPLAVSSAGERGLTQITKTSALTEGALTPAEWDALATPTTSPQEQARIAWKIVLWCWGRAKKYINGAAFADLPSHPAKDAIDQIWYAKLYHQRPVDVRDAKLTGDAAADSRRLETEWSNDASKIHRLHAANVVAWNSVLPPHETP